MVAREAITVKEVKMAAKKEDKVEMRVKRVVTILKNRKIVRNHKVKTVKAEVVNKEEVNKVENQEVRMLKRLSYMEEDF